MSKELDLSKPVQLRCGDKHTLVCADLGKLVNTKFECPILTIYNNTGSLFQWRVSGRLEPSRENSRDLINAPEKHTVYISFCENEFGLFIGGFFHSADTARAAGGSFRIACVRIEFEEGQFDE